MSAGIASIEELKKEAAHFKKTGIKNLDFYKFDGKKRIQIDFPTKTRKLPPEAIEARNAIKNLGGQALVGTYSQKKWAEILRYNVILVLQKDSAEFLLSDKKINSSRFWINCRDKKPEDIVNAIKKAHVLIERLYDLHDEILDYFMRDKKQYIFYVDKEKYEETEKRIDSLREEIKNIYEGKF